MKISLEEQVGVLNSCGIRLLPEITVDNLLASYDRDAYEKEPYVLLLTVMGSELDTEPCTYASDDIWHFDTECIEDHNDYVRIALRFSDLAREALPLEDIIDYVDVEEGKAWLSFKLDGEVYKWTAALEDDWVDPRIISKFAGLLEERRTGRRFTYLDLGGQSCLIGCNTQKGLERLKSLTRLKFVWLSNI
jgi:hypothetical protein